MKGNYQSVQQFAEEVGRREKVKQDYLLPSGKFNMISDTGFAWQGQEYLINDYAHRQVASKIGIPKTYYDAMSVIPDLRSQNVNSWLGFFDQNEDKQFLVRTLDGNVRAFLSDRYKPIDNWFILNAILPVVQEFGNDVRVASNSITDTKMYVQIVKRDLQVEIAKGDIVQAGVIITNSEVGAGRVNIESMVWRLLCTNGMIGSSLLRKNHAGRKIGESESDYDIYANDTIKAELKAYRLRIRDIFRNAFTMAAFSQVTDKIKEAVGDKIVKPTKTIENVTKRFSLPESDKDKIVENMAFENNFTRWGAINGITAIAKFLDDRDCQYDYERIGNQLLEVSPREWSEMAE